MPILTPMGLSHSNHSAGLSTAVIYFVVPASVSNFRLEKTKYYRVLFRFHPTGNATASIGIGLEIQSHARMTTNEVIFALPSLPAVPIGRWRAILAPRIRFD